MFWLHWLAPSSTAVLADLPLVCYLANANCAVVNIVTAPFFVILIVSRSHAFSLVVPICSSLHALVVVAVVSYFQHHILTGLRNRSQVCIHSPRFGVV